jgi:predicted transposase YdaD
VALVTERVRQIVRHFLENGMKVLLGDRANVRDLLGLTGSDLVGGMDFADMTQETTSYVAEDFRHLESDVVWTVPFRGKKAGKWLKRVTVYVLIEHQSEPDPLMTFRVLLYMLRIWSDQLREYQREQHSLRGARLQPILPVVFYTGTRTWDRLIPISDVTEQGDLFAHMMPRLEPLFINLSAMDPEDLPRQGGYFGVLLQVVRDRRTTPAEFRATVHRVVEQLGGMLPEEKTRWLEFLSYIHALVYHERQESERATLHATVTDAVRDEDRRKEVSEMPRTIAEALKEEGRREGSIGTLQDTLLRLMRQRFTKVPASVEKVIRATQQAEQLNTWLDRVLTAPTLKAMGIGANP